MPSQGRMTRQGTAEARRGRSRQHAPHEAPVVAVRDQRWQANPPSRPCLRVGAGPPPRPRPRQCRCRERRPLCPDVLPGDVHNPMAVALRWHGRPATQSPNLSHRSVRPRTQARRRNAPRHCGRVAGLQHPRFALIYVADRPVSRTPVRRPVASACKPSPLPKDPDPSAEDPPSRRSTETASRSPHRPLGPLQSVTVGPDRADILKPARVGAGRWFRGLQESPVRV